MHPHVAPLNGSYTPLATSPQCNVPNNTWDLGESPMGRQGGGAYLDAGGMLDFDMRDPVLADPSLGSGGTGHVHQYQLPGTNVPEGWVANAVTIPANGPIPAHQGTVMRLRGYFRDAPSPGSPVTDGAFEILADPVYRPDRPTILIVSTPATRSYALTSDGRPPEDLGPFSYQGWNSDSGLPGQPAASQDPNRFEANHRFIILNQERRALNQDTHNILCVQAVARIYGLPLQFQLQRNVQLVKAAQKMLQSPIRAWRPPDASWNQALTANVPTLVEGGSFGGYTATWCVLLFPDLFHAAFSTAAPGSIRRYAGEQESWRYLMALSGFGRSGHAYARTFGLWFGSALWQVAAAQAAPGPLPLHWSPLFHTSAIRAWRDGYLKRPIYFVVNDEDSVTTGTDWLPLIDDQRRYHPFGSASANGVTLWWSTSEKRCHDGGAHISAITQALHWEIGQSILDFLPHVPTATLPPASVPTNLANATEDPYEHAFQAAAPFAAPPQPTPVLTLDPNFSQAAYNSLGYSAPRKPGKTFGHGTYLGFGDCTVALGSDIFVGSAEGVITKFVVHAPTGEMVPIAQSVALGYGAWGMVLAEEHSGHPSKELVVATHRGLHVLSTSTLEVLASRSDLPWEMSRPMFLRVADVIQGGKKEILMASEHGVLAIYKVAEESLEEVASYGEPGILDLEVMQVANNVALIAIRSARGHVVLLAWNVSVQSLVVLAISPRLIGTPVDLELEDPGNPASPLVVYLAEARYFQNETILRLDPNTLAFLPWPGTEVGNAHVGGGYGRGRHLDLEIWNDAGIKRFLVLRGDWLFLVNASTGNRDGQVYLGSFAPTIGALDLLVGEFDSSRPGAEVVITTEAGYVSCHSLRAMLTSSGPQPWYLGGSYLGGLTTPADPDLVRQPGVQNGAPRFTSRALAATWGMAADLTSNPRRLEVVDQSGSRWWLNAAGDVTFRHCLTESLGTPFTVPRPGPFRGLARFDSITANNAGSNFTAFGPQAMLQAGIPAWELRTFPYVPLDIVGNLQFGQWVKEFYGPVSSSTSVVHRQHVYDGYAVFAKGGDVLSVGNLPGATRQMAWWSGQENNNHAWGNRVQGIHANANTILKWWSTTQGPDVGGPNTVPHTSIQGHELRSSIAGTYAMHDAQSMRMFRDPVSNLGLVAVMTPGARLIVLQPGVSETDIGPSPKELDSAGSPFDYGTGGMALATHARPPGDSGVDLYVGSVAFFAANQQHKGPQSPGTPADPMVSVIAAIRYTGSASFSGSTLVETQRLVLDGGAANRPRVYGVCGIAVGDVIPGNNLQEIVVTSLDGHVLVYERDDSGTFGPLVYQTMVEGSVGAFNSIVIADLDDNGQNELYVAGSLGIRKFIPNPLP